jgi:hypothetical protein
MKASSLVVAAALMALPAHAALHAQSLPGKATQVGVMGGFTLPAGDLASSAYHAGNAGALVTFRAPASHLRFRLDGQWQQLTGNLYGGGPVPETNGYSTAPFRRRSYRVLDATANAVYSGALARSARAYVIGGLGVYDVRGTTHFQQGTLLVDESSGATRMGLNGGAGVSVGVGHLATFIEARYHRLLGSHAYEKDGVDGGAPGAFQIVSISAGIIL